MRYADGMVVNVIHKNKTKKYKLRNWQVWLFIDYQVKISGLHNICIGLDIG